MSGTDQRGGVLHFASGTPSSRSHKFLQSLPICDQVFKHLEDYDEMTIEYLSFTKIGKVLRHIGLKDNIPRQEEFRFQERAKALVEGWVRLFPPGGVRNYAKGSSFKESGGMYADSSILHDMIRARRSHIGSIGGLKEVVVENATGGATSLTLPYS